MSIHLINPHVIMNLHRKVMTALGEGMSQGNMRIKRGDVSMQAMLVRLPVNDVTRPHLGDQNCVTPRAKKTALFVFPMSENGFISKELAEWLNWIVFVLVLLFLLLKG